jgi:lipopolysaccharide biosynthesis glycosyltransferase
MEREQLVFPTIEEETRTPLVVACGADDRYSMALGVVLQSLLTHLRRDTELYLYILDGGISENNKKRLSRVVEGKPFIKTHLEWKYPDVTQFQQLKTIGHITAATYLRLLVPDFVPDRFDKAIYLDCDLLVEADLTELWEYDISDHALLAAQDYLIPYVSSVGGMSKYAEWGLDPALPYLNAGVLVFNLRRWRAELLGQRVFRFLQEHGEHLTFNDQDGLNVVMAGDWGMIEPRWNVATSILMFDQWMPSSFRDGIGPLRAELLNGRSIHHFVGSMKPWHLDCQHPAKLRWRQVLAQSRWFEPVETARPRSQPRSQGMPERPMTTVTIFIPTYNRAPLLRTCLASVLAQDYSDFQVVVLDNASSDDTQAVVRSFKDSRVTCLGNEVNIGLVGNWLRALELNASQYFTILPDDDVMLPEFIRLSVTALDGHPDAAFCTGLAEYIDAEGNVRDRQVVTDFPEGLIRGMAFLDCVVAGTAWNIHPATVMLRAAASAEVGSFAAVHSKHLFDLNLYQETERTQLEPRYAVHSKHQFDLNLYCRLAANFDLFFFQRRLAQVRQHPEQARKLELQAVEGSRQLAMTAERIEAIGHLMHSERAADGSYRAWLGERLQTLNQVRSDLTCRLVPSLGIGAIEWMQMEAQRIASVIPPENKFILVNENMWAPESVAGRIALPFLERGGQYWGQPENDQIAIREVERMRGSGSSFMVFSPPGFWWLDYYAQFHRYLRLEYQCVLDDDRLVVFDLRKPASGDISHEDS